MATLPPPVPDPGQARLLVLLDRARAEVLGHRDCTVSLAQAFAVAVERQPRERWLRAV